MAEFRIRGLHPALLRRLGERAHELGLTVAQAIVQAITQWLENEGQ